MKRKARLSHTTSADRDGVGVDIVLGAAQPSEHAESEDLDVRLHLGEINRVKVRGPGEIKRRA